MWVYTQLLIVKSLQGYLKKCPDHDNTTVKNVALIALNNSMSYVGNNYRQILSKYQNVLNNSTCMYDHFRACVTIIWTSSQF